MGLDPLEW